MNTRTVILVAAAGRNVTAEGLVYMQPCGDYPENVVVEATGTICIDGIPVDPPAAVASVWAQMAFEHRETYQLIGPAGRDAEILDSRMAAYGIGYAALHHAGFDPHRALPELRAQRDHAFDCAVEAADPAREEGVWYAHFLHLTLSRLEWQLERAAEHIWIKA